MKRIALLLLLCMVFIPSLVKAATDVTITGASSIHATIADALTNDPIACGASQFVIDIAANGVLTCALVNFNMLAGTATDAQIPHLNTLSTNLATGKCVRTNDTTGNLEAASADCGTGGGGSSAFSALTTSTNTTATMTVGTGASLTTSGGGSIAATTAAALAANGGNCSAGQSPLGVDASGASEGCFDVATQVELDAHINGTSVHSATNLNTANRIVLRDGSGNFSAGTITAALVGNASTATALANNPPACSSGQYVNDVDASVTLSCAQVQFSQLGGIATDAQVPDLNSLSTGLVGGRCVRTNDSTGLFEVASTDCGSGGGGSGTVSSGTSGRATYYTGATTVGDSTAVTMDSTDVLTVKNKFTNITTNTTLGAHNVVTCDSSGGAVTFTLPSASTTTVGKYKFVKTTSDNNVCSVVRAGSDTINGATTAVSISTQWGVVEVELINNSSPGNWHAITSKAQFGYIKLPIQAAKLYTSNSAIIAMDEPRPKLLFDTSVSWCASWTVQMDDDFASFTSWTYSYAMTSATSGSLALDLSIWATSSADAIDSQTESYDTANSCDDSAVNSTAGRMETLTCSITNGDSTAADDLVTFKVCRDVANDNASGNGELLGLRVKYLKN